MQPVHCCHVAARRLVHVRVGDDVADREAPAGPQHPGRLAEDRGLVAGEVDHAVGDDHVDRVVRERHLLDRPLQELDVLDSGLALVARAPARASRRSCRGRRPCPSGRPGGRRAGRRCRRPSRGRGRSRPRAARPPRSGCRSRARRAWRRREAPPVAARRRAPAPKPRRRTRPGCPSPQPHAAAEVRSIAGWPRPTASRPSPRSARATQPRGPRRDLVLSVSSAMRSAPPVLRG